MVNYASSVRYPFLLSVAGVALMAITTVYGAIRGMMVRATFRGGVSSSRQFGTSFGLTSSLTILAIIIAIAGLTWLGLTLRHSQNTAS